MSEKLTYQKLEKRVLELEAMELELKKIEMLLYDEFNWRRLLIMQSRDAIVILDQNAKVFEANTRFADILVYSKELVYGLHAWDGDTQYNREQIRN